MGQNTSGQNSGGMVLDFDMIVYGYGLVKIIF
jgi:hypothetical protein